MAKPYNPSLRHWVKLWVKEWLTGTIRFELTPAQRGIFVDLIVLAGNSRSPGVISPGFDGDKRLGYPVSWLAGTLVCPEQELIDTITICEDQERIGVERQPDGSLIISITNWDKYQSDYLRQAKYRKRVTPPVTEDVKQEGKSNTLLLSKMEKEKKKEKKDEDEDIPPKSPRGGNAHEKVTPEFIDSLVTQWSPTFGGDEKVRDIIAAALNHKAVDKAKDKTLYLQRWLQRDADKPGGFFGGPREKPGNVGVSEAFTNPEKYKLEHPDSRHTQFMDRADEFEADPAAYAAQYPSDILSRRWLKRRENEVKA